MHGIPSVVRLVGVASLGFIAVSSISVVACRSDDDDLSQSASAGSPTNATGGRASGESGAPGDGGRGEIGQASDDAGAAETAGTGGVETGSAGSSDEAGAGGVGGEGGEGAAGGISAAGAGGMLETAAAAARTLSVGQDSVCAVSDSGTVLCWGNNNDGQLGNGDIAANDGFGSYPETVSNISGGATAVSVGAGAACAIVYGGLECWGVNLYGQLGTGSSAVTESTPDWALISGVSAVSMSNDFGCAVVGGGVRCWGDNSAGELGNGTTMSEGVPVLTPLDAGVVDVVSGTFSACSLMGDGTVQCWGTGGSGQNMGTVPTPRDGLADVSYLAPVCAVIRGQVKCWYGDETSSVSGLPNVVAVADGNGFSCALTQAGGVMCWGQGGLGQLGNGETQDSNAPVSVSGLDSGVTEISVGGQTSCARLAAGGIRCWGDNGHGQLGDGANEPYSAVPVDVLGFAHGT